MSTDVKIPTISPLDESAMDAARERQAQLAKPPGSLGRLEELSVQLAGITGKVHNKIEKKHLLVFAADNGVVAEGVSSAPQCVTLMQTIHLTRHKTGASTLCKHFGCGITACDVGVNGDIKEPKVLKRKIGYKLAMDAMNLQPLFLPGMGLGEGSGCPLAFEILGAACAIIKDMATFDQAGIDDGYLDEIRAGGKFTVEGAK